MGKFSRILLATALTIPLFVSGCGGHRQAYVWGPGESTYYVQWEHETHRDHVEWEQRPDADHGAYWKWRRHHQ
jgi:hypothetical protein